MQALTETGGVVYMSDSVGSCEAGQSPTVKSADGSGTLQLESTGLLKVIWSLLENTNDFNPFK